MGGGSPCSTRRKSCSNRRNYQNLIVNRHCFAVLDDPRWALLSALSTHNPTRRPVVRRLRRGSAPWCCCRLVSCRVCSGKETKGCGRSLGQAPFYFCRASEVGERIHPGLGSNFLVERTLAYYLTLTTHHLTRRPPSTTGSTTTTTISIPIDSYIMTLSRAGSIQSSEHALCPNPPPHPHPPTGRASRITSTCRE